MSDEEQMALHDQVDAQLGRVQQAMEDRLQWLRTIELQRDVMQEQRNAMATMVAFIESADRMAKEQHKQIIEIHGRQIAENTPSKQREWHRYQLAGSIMNGLLASGNVDANAVERCYDLAEKMLVERDRRAAAESGRLTISATLPITFENQLDVAPPPTVTDGTEP